ncbi:hypothetical protein PENTCL1PPCAC_7387, partial [Pristionchus entomophagus]
MPAPLMEIDRSNKDTQPNRLRFNHLVRIFSETNRDELIRVVKSTPATCLICSVHLSNMRDVVNHIFSQPHIDKFVKRRGSVSNREFAFWKNLLEMFPESRKRVSKQTLQQLKASSSTLDLHPRDNHFTVKVDSASEREAAICHFVSSSFSLLQRVAVSVKDQKETYKINDLILKKFSTATSVFALTDFIGEEKLYHVYIEGPNRNKWAGQATLYVRPPDPFNAFCAYVLCKSQSSVMLINSLEEEKAFRAFEKKFMHSDKTPLVPIYNGTALKILEETFKVEAKKRNKVDLSISSSLEPELTATVPPAEVNAKPRITVSSEVSVSPSRVVPSKMAEKPLMRTVVWTVKTYCIEHKNTVSIPEEGSGKESIVNEIGETKWPEIHIPFDEEMGKKVDEIIKIIA